MGSDLDTSQTTTSGFFVADLRDLAAQVFTDWAIPGDKYFRVRFNCNAVHALKTDPKPTALEISTANTEWEAFSQAIRVRIRLFQECSIKKKLPAVEVYCLYATFIPQVSDAAIKAINTANFKYLGQTWNTAKTAFANDVVWLQFWLGGFMDNVISGYEADAV